MVSWLETVVKEKVEKMIEQKADEYIKKYLEVTLEKTFSEALTSGLSAQINQILLSNEKKIKEALAQLNDVDSVLKAHASLIREKLKTQLEKSLNNVNFDIQMTKEYNESLSSKIANYLFRMIADNPNFIYIILKAKLTSHLQNSKIFGKETET